MIYDDFQKTNLVIAHSALTKITETMTVNDALYNKLANKYFKKEDLEQLADSILSIAAADIAEIK